MMDAGKPIILLLGEIVLAHKEWDSLTAIAQLRVYWFSLPPTYCVNG